MSFKLVQEINESDGNEEKLTLSEQIPSKNFEIDKYDFVILLLYDEFVFVT